MRSRFLTGDGLSCAERAHAPMLHWVEGPVKG
jgi:hypothetical protein